MIRHIVAAGGSYTADGIGGTPPIDCDNQGGCSFNDPRVQPRTWVSKVAQNLQVQSLVNTAGVGFGPSVTAMSLIEVLTRFPYDPRDTLVLFDVTDPWRLGVPCPWNHIDASPHVPWSPDIIPWSILDKHAERGIIVEMQHEQVEVRSAFDLQSLFDFLNVRQFRYRWVMGIDFRSNHLLAPMLCSDKNLLLLEDGPSMFEYAERHDLVGEDGHHPNALVHDMVCEKIIESI